MTNGDSTDLIERRADYFRVLRDAGVEQDLARDMAAALEECWPVSEADGRVIDYGYLAV